MMHVGKPNEKPCYPFSVAVLAEFFSSCCKGFLSLFIIIQYSFLYILVFVSRILNLEVPVEAREIPRLTSKRFAAKPERLLSCAGIGFHDTTHNDMYYVADVCANGCKWHHMMYVQMASSYGNFCGHYPALPFLLRRLAERFLGSRWIVRKRCLIALAYVPHFPSFRSLNIWLCI